METIGRKIRAARKEKNIRLSDLGEIVGLTAASLSDIENDKLKNGPTPELIIRIADALGDRSILVYALMHNPICQRIIPRAFAPLNNINDNPSAILAKLREELTEALDAEEILSRMFSNKDPERLPAFKETLLAKLEQLFDVVRNIEEAFDKFKACGALTEEEHIEVRIRQQAKVERNGHHRPDLDRRTGDDRRNGTEG